MLPLSANAVVTDPQLQLVDIRSHHERYGGLGFVPGSLGEPYAGGALAFWERACELTAPQQPVLSCLSGLSARGLARALQDDCDTEVAYLDEGIVGWGSAGLPLCGRGPAAMLRQRLAGEDFARYLSSTFVGELAPAAIERNLDPVLLVRECFDRAGVPGDEGDADRLLRVLDHAAITSLRFGVPLRRVATTIDHLLALLP